MYNFTGIFEHNNNKKTEVPENNNKQLEFYKCIASFD